MRRRQERTSQARLAIRKAVEEHPGIHFRGIARAAAVTSAGQLRHHLDKLERAGEVVEVEDGRYRRFFVAGHHDPRLRAGMARFSRAVPRRIARLLLESPMNRSELRRSLHCADSTLGYHLSRMVMLGDLARLRGPQSCVYSLAREDEVRRMLLVQGAGEDPVPGGPGAPGPGPGPAHGHPHDDAAGANVWPLERQSAPEPRGPAPLPHPADGAWEREGREREPLHPIREGPSFEGMRGQDERFRGEAAGG